MDAVAVLIIDFKHFVLQLTLDKTRSLKVPYLFVYSSDNLISKFKLFYLGKFDFANVHFSSQTFQIDD